MNNHPIPGSFAVEEGFARASREVERQQLIRIVKGQKDGHQGRWLPGLSPTGLWNSLVARLGRTVDSASADASDARAWWATSTEPQEECC